MLNDTQIEELNRKLDPSNVKKRPDSGMSYIEAWHAIAEANRIFGHAEWSSETVELKENCDPTQNQKGNHVVSFRAKVRVSVNGSVREGVGFGSGIAKDIHAAYEGAIKEAESDARKRALMTFGWPFGLALYDKDQKNVGVEEQKNWKDISIDIQNRINDCIDHGSLNIFIEEHEKLMEEMPMAFADTIHQLIDQRARDIDAGPVKKWPYRFKGTEDAKNWFVAAYPKIDAMENLSDLAEWHRDNFHMIESLAILDKAEKYKKDGKTPQQRLDDLIGFKMKSFQPIAAE